MTQNQNRSEWVATIQAIGRWSKSRNQTEPHRTAHFTWWPGKLQLYYRPNETDTFLVDIDLYVEDENLRSSLTTELSEQIAAGTKGFIPHELTELKSNLESTSRYLREVNQLAANHGFKLAKTKNWGLVWKKLKTNDAPITSNQIDATLVEEGVSETTIEELDALRVSTHIPGDPVDPTLSQQELGVPEST